MSVQALLYHDPVNRSFNAFQTTYGVGPTGINLYFGVTEARVQSGKVLTDDHQFVLEQVRQRALQTPELVLGVSLLPLEFVEPYRTIAKPESQALIQAFAEELAALQTELPGLEIYIRYASEMNDPATPKQPYGFKGQDPQGVPLNRQIEEFKSTFSQCRKTCRDVSPRLKFCFSPAIRANLGDRYARLPKYYPGDGQVDAFTCTWYVGKKADLIPACKTLRAYCLHRLGHGLPFAIDELGGSNPDGDRADVLVKMFEHLDDLEKDQIQFRYAAVFLESKWGQPKVGLSFLAQRFPVR